MRNHVGLRSPRWSRRCGARCKKPDESTAIAAALFVRGAEEIGAVLATRRGAGRRRPITGCCGFRGLPRRPEGAGRGRRRSDHFRCVLRRGNPRRSGRCRPHGIHGCTDSAERCRRCTNSRFNRLRCDLSGGTCSWSDCLGSGRGDRRRPQRWRVVVRRRWWRRRGRLCAHGGCTHDARSDDDGGDQRARNGRHGITVTVGEV